MDVMEVASLATSMAQQQTLSQVGMAVLDMALEAGEVQGENTAASLESLVNPAVGGNIDIAL